METSDMFTQDTISVGDNIAPLRDIILEKETDHVFLQGSQYEVVAVLEKSFVLVDTLGRDIYIPFHGAANDFKKILNKTTKNYIFFARGYKTEKGEVVGDVFIHDIEGELPEALALSLVNDYSVLLKIKKDLSFEPHMGTVLSFGYRSKEQTL